MVKVALVGAGGMGSMHAGCYAAIANAQLTGVYDTRPDTAAALAGKHGCRAFSDFDAMLSESGADIVDVCCPTPWHAEYVCRAAASAGAVGLRGIAVEKPMARTVAECEQMTVACEAAAIPLFIAHVVRFFPEFAQAKRQVEAGAVGAPAAIRTRRGGAMPRGWNDWFADFSMSGGVILDLMVHDFDWMRWTFGDVQRVYAKGLLDSRLPAFDYALVTLRFASGAIGHVEGTWADPSGFKVAIEIAGDKGLLEYNFNQPTATPFQAALTSAEGPKAGVALPESPVAVSPYQSELQHFVDCIEQGVRPSIAPADGAAAVRIACAAEESIRTGRTVAIDA